MELSIFRIHEKLIEMSWPKAIEESILKEQLQVKEFMQKEYGEGIREIRMGFHTLSLKLKIPITQEDCEDILSEIKDLRTVDYQFPSKLWKIPVCYGGTQGKDLEKLAQARNLTVEEVIKIHSTPKYLLHFYGFLPGFMYLGGLDSQLHTPRKNTPDRKIQAGTVAIGESQTGIYPIESPGGWHAIGKTLSNLWKWDSPEKPEIGDRIQFQPVSVDELKSLQGRKINHSPW